MLLMRRSMCGVSTGKDGRCSLAHLSRRQVMSISQFEPQFMKISVLTAALQELTPREVRDPDPDRAIEEWVEFASELSVDNIQLSAALHPTESDIPAEAMLDPVANTLDLREPFNERRANRVLTALGQYKI